MPGQITQDVQKTLLESDERPDISGYQNRTVRFANWILRF
jgi:hypothetical protein